MEVDVNSAKIHSGVRSLGSHTSSLASVWREDIPAHGETTHTGYTGGQGEKDGKKA